MAPITAQDVAELLRRTAEANVALLRGDVHGYLARIRHADDYTLMAPFGGAPTRGFDPSPERVAAMGRFFRSGTSEQEVVQTYASGDLAVLVVIERQRAVVGELPEPSRREAAPSPTAIGDAFEGEPVRLDAL